MKKFRSPPDWTPKQRHSAYTDKSGGPNACWPWVGGRNKAGYGLFGVDGACVLAHRKAYEFEHGPIPAEVKILHSCDNRPCQNPDLLFPGSQADNVADMRAKGRERKATGERHALSKLTADQVAAIRADTRSQSVIAREYGVVQTTVSCIKLGKTWATAQGIKITVPERG
jgi:hypothetical protein